MKVTLKTIAERAGVSQPLVSKILNGQECRVSGEKRELVKKIAKELGYQPKQFSGRSSKKPTNVIGLIQPSMDFKFIVRLTDEIQYAAKKKGYDLVIFNSHEDSDQERRCFELCLNYGVDGVLVSAADYFTNADYYKDILQRGVPMVFVDRRVLDVDCNFVVADNFQGTYLLTKKLIERGHSKILFLSHGDLITKSSVISRFEGYQAAMMENGLGSAKEIVHSGLPLEHQMICKTVPQSNPFTAIVLSTTWDFAKLLELLRLIMCENDAPIDIAAFDSFEIPYLAIFKDNVLKYINPHLLIMEQDPQKMAEAGVDILVDEIHGKGKEGGAFKNIFLPPELIEFNG
jgi:LacI family transcriptional regulator